jgi:hypothetical protein
MKQGFQGRIRQNRKLRLRRIVRRALAYVSFRVSGVRPGIALVSPRRFTVLQRTPDQVMNVLGNLFATIVLESRWMSGLDIRWGGKGHAGACLWRIECHAAAGR